MRRSRRFFSRSLAEIPQLVERIKTDDAIKGAVITLDSHSGDLAADGPVTTASILKQDDGKGGTLLAGGYVDFAGEVPR